MNPAGRGTLSRRGFTVIELMVAVSAGLVLVALIGFVFVRQIKSYGDIEVQSQVQAQTKKAIRMMAREIANAGSGAASPFFPTHSSTVKRGSGSLKFSYRDLTRRHCGSESDLVSVTYKVVSVTGGEALVQDVQCNAGTAVRESMVKSDSIGLQCAYLDRNGSALGTWNEANLKAVECSVLVKPKTHKDLFDRTRAPVLRVRLGNI
jgi:prepilin-type N-terminal cleavage/methylation domain-containing protein